MEKERLENMEKEYDELLEKDFITQLKGRIRKLSPEEFKEKVIAFLKDNKICTLATCSRNIPRSTPVRYRSRGLTIYILTEGGGKVKNIIENPQVSLSIVGEYPGFQSVTGLQIWGRAEIIKPGDGQRYQEAKTVINLEEREDLRKMKIQNVRDMYIIKIETERARYLSFPEGILNQVVTLI
ncbi:MAG: pyridoxamine 5'-phosphate oxidase family protein [Proteobacteria bacterium]|nr:pyridoxamine 5'-phosphate oxidase family protein [Pseudomonadota bacterium]